MTEDYAGFDLPNGGSTTLTCTVVYASDIKLSDGLSVHIEDDTQNPLPKSNETGNGQK